MKRVIRIENPSTASMAIESTPEGTVTLRAEFAGGVACTAGLAPDEARRIGRALIEAAGDDSAGRTGNAEIPGINSGVACGCMDGLHLLRGWSAPSPGHQRGLPM